MDCCKSAVFRVPLCRSYIDEDDDSGADSLGNDFSSSGGNNGSGNGHGRYNYNGYHGQHRASPASMALVPYQDPTGGCDSCGFHRWVPTCIRIIPDMSKISLRQAADQLPAAEAAQRGGETAAAGGGQGLAPPAGALRPSIHPEKISIDIPRCGLIIGRLAFGGHRICMHTLEPYGACLI